MRVLVKYLLVFCLLVPIAFLHAQFKPADLGISSKKAVRYYEEGLTNEQWRDYRKAIEWHSMAIEIEPEFGLAHYHVGHCYYTLREYDKAKPYLEKASEILGNDAPGLLGFELAELAFYKNDFTTAVKGYELFLSKKPRVHRKFLSLANKHLKSAKFAIEQKDNVISFKPVNMGSNVNSKWDDYLPYLTADDQTLFFTSRRKESTGEPDPRDGAYPEDFFYCHRQGTSWGSASNLGPPVNTILNEGAASFSPDGQYVYFTACNRRDGYGSCDIYYSRLIGNTWSAPENLGPLVNSPDWESQPCISNDGKTLYFVSNRPGGVAGAKKDGDIWFSKKENGRWTKAQNLGRPINSVGRESSPFLHADGQTFYFASEGHPGFGGSDLFMSKKSSFGWGKPTNLGQPLNTASDETNIFINSKGDKGYINSNRPDGFGGHDIYEFELDTKIRPNFATFVRGTVLDKVTGKKLAAEVTFINLESGDTIRSVFSNKSSGKFLLSLPLGQEYAAFVDRKGYLFHSQNFSLKEFNAQNAQYYDLTIELKPIEIGETIVLENIFYETGMYQLKPSSHAELDHLVTFLKKNPRLVIEIAGHTDDVGSDTDNLELSKNRSGEVKKYLTAKRIKADRIISKGYGESKPVCRDQTEDCRARNRRTEFKIISNQ